MKLEFDKLKTRETVITKVDVYKKDKDTAVIKYKFAGQELSFSCNKEEYESINFNQDGTKFKLPDFLEIKTNSANKQYLARKGETAESEGEDW